MIEMIFTVIMMTVWHIYLLGVVFFTVLNGLVSLNGDGKERFKAAGITGFKLVGVILILGVLWPVYFRGFDESNKIK